MGLVIRRTHLIHAAKEPWQGTHPVPPQSSDSRVFESGCSPAVCGHIAHAALGCSAISRHPSHLGPLVATFTRIKAAARSSAAYGPVNDCKCACSHLQVQYAGYERTYAYVRIHACMCICMCSMPLTLKSYAMRVQENHREKKRLRRRSPCDRINQRSMSTKHQLNIN